MTDAIDEVVVETEDVVGVVVEIDRRKVMRERVREFRWSEED